MASLATFAEHLDGGARVHEGEDGAVAGVSVHDVCAAFGFSHRSWKRYACTAATSEGVQSLVVTGRRPDGRAKAVSTPMFTSLEALRAAVARLLRASKKSAEEIRRVAEAAGLEADVLACSYVSMPEKDVLQALADLLPAEWGFEQQLAIGPYRLDAYIPAKRVAICVDEHGHAQYDAERERERECYLRRTLTCSFVRVDPIQTETGLPSMVRAVFRAVSNYDREVARPLALAQAQLCTERLYEGSAGGGSSEQDGSDRERGSGDEDEV